MKSYRNSIRLFLAAVSVSAFLGGAVRGAEKSADFERQMQALRDTSTAFAEIAKKAMPAVVFIRVEKTLDIGVNRMYQVDPFEDFFGDEFFRRFFPEYRGGRGLRPGQPQPRQFRQQGQGSGFLISADGYILTNHHVVGDADRITVRLNDRREFEAKLVGSDDKSEVAVVKIEADALPFLELGDSSKLEIGNWVMAVGNPFGLTETVTTGIVSAKGRSGMNITDYEDFIQTDAAISPGNSGGPLLDIDGKVVGINTAIWTRSGGYMGIGFAVPINLAGPIKDQLMKSGKVTRGYLGIYIQELTEELAESFDLDKAGGILVSGVGKGSPAEQGGIEPGDIISDLNGRAVKGVTDFRNEVAATKPGTKLALKIFRDGKSKEINVITGTLPDHAEDMEPAEPEMARKLGMNVGNLTEETAREYGYEIGDGVLVTEVDPDGLAVQAGIQPGCLITGVNRQPVKNVKEFQDAVSKSEKRGRILLRVRQGAGSRFVVIRFK